MTRGETHQSPVFLCAKGAPIARFENAVGSIFLIAIFFVVISPSHLRLSCSAGLFLVTTILVYLLRYILSYFTLDPYSFKGSIV